MHTIQLAPIIWYVTSDVQLVSKCEEQSNADPICVVVVVKSVEVTTIYSLLFPVIDLFVVITIGRYTIR